MIMSNFLVTMTCSDRLRILGPSVISCVVSDIVFAASVTGSRLSYLLRFLSERSEMKKRFYTIPAGPFLSPDVFPQCVGMFGDFRMINILTYVSKRRSEASVSFFLKSLGMDHFRCSVAPQFPIFSLCCIFFYIGWDPPCNCIQKYSRFSMCCHGCNKSACHHLD